MISKLQKIGIAFFLFIFVNSFCFAQNSNGFFRVEQRGGVWWLITPDGKPFFSNGVNVVSMGNTRERYNPENPEYAAFRYYKTDEDWQKTTLQRLKDWNFNTIGGWSSESLEKRGEMPYVKAFYWGEKLVPWSDVFDEKTETEIDEKVRRDVVPLKDDKNLIGYFSDNELEWWDDAVFYHFLNQPPQNKTRQVLMRVFREHYKNNFAELKRNFNTTAKNFNSFEKEKEITLKPNGDGAQIIDRFVFLLASRYYKIVHDAIRRVDKNHLILGDRYPSWYSQAVVRASIPYVDVVSTNYMADWTDGNFSRFYLDSLYRLTKKPIIVTEYYIAARENRSGNKNSKEIFPTVDTQIERAASFRTNLTNLAATPHLVGAHWFQFYDEPTKGRADGEDYNMGLVDIHDQPYEELTDAAKAINPAEIHARKKTEKAVNFIPKATENIGKDLREWNKNASFVAADLRKQTNPPFADLYASWDAKNLYLAVYAMDYTDLRIYPNSQMPDSERMTWTLNFAGKLKPLKILFGDGGETKIVGEKMEFASLGDSTRYTVFVKIPVSKFGRKMFKTGDKISLNAKLASHSRAEKMEWNKEIKLAD